MLLPSILHHFLIVSLLGHPSDENAGIGTRTTLGSDVQGNVLGMVTDATGQLPVEGASVTLIGECKAGSWLASATSDANGLFCAPMPIGLKGTIAISSNMKGVVREDIAEAACLQYGLIPEGSHASKMSLDGTWRFAIEPPADFWKPGFDDSDWSDITVPSHWIMEGFRSLDGVGGYRKIFRAGTGSGRVMLRFEGVYSGAEVWLNGAWLAYHEGGFTPFEVDATDALIPGDNLLAVQVTEHTVTSDQLDRMSLYADFPLAGIFREVFLYRLPETHIGLFQVNTVWDKRYQDAQLEGRIAVDNVSAASYDDALLEFILMDLDGKEIPCTYTPPRLSLYPWKRSDAPFEIHVPNAKGWTAETPHLYSLTIRLKSHRQTIQEFTERIGFRQTEIKGTEILINGRPVKFRGTCHHDSDPIKGRAVDAEITRRDLEDIKRANLNSLRTSHYPPTPHLPKIADELGVYVEDEGSFCWMMVPQNPNYTLRVMQINAEMLARDRNHPSVFMWSLCNESHWGFSFDRSHEWVRKNDPTRLCSAGQSAELEIITTHNPLDIEKIDAMESRDKPHLDDESLAPHQGSIMNDVFDMWIDPGFRDYYVEPMPPIYEKFMKSKVTQGSMIWAWADDIFCVPTFGLEYGRGHTFNHYIEREYKLPGKGITGDAPWGVVDGWRREKPEFWHVKKLHSPVKIREKSIPIPLSGEPLRISIENQYDFLNLSELKTRWAIFNAEGVPDLDKAVWTWASTDGGRKQKGCKEQGNASPKIPAKATGELVIAPEKPLEPGSFLAVKFVDASGMIVDVFLLPIGEKFPVQPSVEKVRDRPLNIRDITMLGGVTKEIIGKDFEISFQMRGGPFGDWTCGYGMIRRCVAFGEPILFDLPSIHVLPAGDSMHPLPLRALPPQRNFETKSVDVQREGENVRVRVDTVQTPFSGTYDLLITPTADITVHYSLVNNGPDLLAREIGLRFGLPLECSLFEWDRQAEWSVYPPDHIGRPHGKAPAFSGKPKEIPPTWPYSEDDSSMGSNDFRSTKRHINWALLRYPKGPGILVKSDGRQSARAIVESDRISFYVNQWYGGTSTGAQEWRHYGWGRTIKTGDTIEDTVVFRLVRRT